MSDQPIIEVQNLSKRYVLGAGGSAGARDGGGTRYRTLRESLSNSARRLFRPGPRQNGNRSAAVAAPVVVDPQEFWALRDVSFTVRPGEVVGIIGRNGAGKSTLLKILSRITEPTEGTVRLRGRVASLLEVGTGFHPELTGRENIYLNGAILGMARAEIRAKFDEIVAFAEVERFLDTPVKRYSSGMYVRLAFAVAAHLEPEILIIDEVLAVGDAEFQKKCLGKMDQVAQSEGRTVLFVSHNMGAVAQLCGRVIFLQQGNLVSNGDTKTVMNAYLKSASKQQDGERLLTASDMVGKPMFIVRAVARGTAGEPGTHFGHDEALTLDITYEVRSAVTGAEIGLGVRDERGRRIFISETSVPQESDRDPSERTARVIVPGNVLVPGRYLLNFHIHVPGVTSIDFVEDLLTLTLVDAGSHYSRYGDLDYGCVFVNCQWDTEVNVFHTSVVPAPLKTTSICDATQTVA